MKDVIVRPSTIIRCIIFTPYSALILSMSVLQHLYLGALYGLLALKSVFLDDFKAFFDGHIGT